jgi:YggT family protein
VILSWVAPNSPNPILQLIEEISSKLLEPIRKFIPSAGGLDFSPIFALILIRQLEILLASIIRSFV